MENVLVQQNAIVALDSLVNATSIDQVWTTLTQSLAGYGFDRLFYGYTRFHTRSGLGPRDDFLILSSMPEDYSDRYIREEMFRHAPMTRWARDNVGAMSWGWVSANKSSLNQSELAVLSFNQAFDVTAGYTIAFHDPVTRHKGAIALAARAGLSQTQVDSIWGRYGDEINVINQVAHLKFGTLPLPRSQQSLSPRQREVLEWVGDGKTTQDIATILDLTPATIEKHLRRARDTLSVETTAQAVRKASVLNQIYIVEP